MTTRSWRRTTSGAPRPATVERFRPLLFAAAVEAAGYRPDLSAAVAVPADEARNWLARLLGR